MFLNLKLAIYIFLIQTKITIYGFDTEGTEISVSVKN